MIMLLATVVTLAIAGRLALSGYRGLRAGARLVRVPRVRVADLGHHRDAPRLRLSGRLRASQRPLSSIDGRRCIAIDQEARDTASITAPSLRERRCVRAVLDDGTGEADIDLEGFSLHVDAEASEHPASSVPAAIRVAGANTLRVTEHLLTDELEVTLFASVMHVERVADGYREAEHRHRLGGSGHPMEVWPCPSWVVSLRAWLFPLLTLLISACLAFGAYLFASASVAASSIERVVDTVERPLR